MRLGLLAKKVGMSRFYDSSGVNHPVTILKVDESKIVDIKTDEKNGYSAVRLSLGKSKRKNNKSVKGFLKKQNISSFLFSKEFRVSETSNYRVGDNVSVSNFIEGQFVDVTSSSKGKGFAGGMKRHNFGGNRATHGVSISHRSHGSTGQCQDPGKVFKGKKMAGRLGNKKVTIQNLKVLNIDMENNLIILKGAVPGHKGSVIKIVDSVKKNQKISLQTPATEAPKPIENNTKSEQTPVIETPKPIETETKSQQNQTTESSKPIESQTKTEVPEKSPEETSNPIEHEPKDGNSK